MTATTVFPGDYPDLLIGTRMFKQSKKARRSSASWALSLALIAGGQAIADDVPLKSLTTKPLSFNATTKTQTVRDLSTLPPIDMSLLPRKQPPQKSQRQRSTDAANAEMEKRFSELEDRLLRILEQRSTPKETATEPTPSPRQGAHGAVTHTPPVEPQVAGPILESANPVVEVTQTISNQQAIVPTDSPIVSMEPPENGDAAQMPAAPSPTNSPPQRTLTSTLMQDFVAPTDELDSDITQIVSRESGSPLNPPPPPPQEAIDRLSAIVAVAHRANEKGFGLASRGAYYTAQDEFVKTLRQVAGALDQLTLTNDYTKSLVAGLRALQEVEDFTPQRIDSDLDLASIIDGHRTPVLQDVDVSQMSPTAATNAYYTYAQDHLAASCGSLPVAARSLYELGKIHKFASQRDPKDRSNAKSITLVQAALIADPDNHKAANELGVLLAEYGQLEEAARAFQHSVALHPESHAWYNLAVVHQRLGQTDLAGKAQREAQIASVREREQRIAMGFNQPDSPFVVVSPQEFNDGRAFANQQHATANQRQPQQTTPNKKTAWWNPWSKVVR